MLCFQLPIKAFSVNAYYYKTRSFKTPAAQDWETMVCYRLAKVPGLRELAVQWKELGGVFHVQMTFVYPMDVYFNKAGHVSAKAFDLSNVEKPLLDMIFRETLEVDDRFVTELISRKRAGAAYGIEVCLELKTQADANLLVSVAPDSNEDVA